MTKIILVAVFLQIFPGAEKDTSEIRVMSSVSVEFDGQSACENAIKGLWELGDASGFKVNAMCVPKGIAKLEVEPKPKPKVKPENAS